MKPVNWVELAKQESHWCLWFLKKHNKLPSVNYWLSQHSIGNRIKLRLRKLLQSPELAHLLKRMGIAGREVAAIVTFNNIKEGYFDRTYRKFRKSPPPFPYEKNLSLLKKRHMEFDLAELIHRRNPKMPLSAYQAITNQIVGLL